MISVCIPTYKRPNLLGKLIQSIINQKSIDDYKIEIIVVDNDKDRTAEKTVINFKKDFFDLYYYVQPLKNISLTRNLAVQKSKGDILYFADDDEYLDEMCLYNLMKSLSEYKADVVFGTVIPVYNKNTPKWIKKGKFFEKKRVKTGDFPKDIKTGNCVVKKQVIDDIRKPFDIKYGITGGSDSHFFRKLLQRDVKMICCNEAVVYEFFPQKRTNLKWLVKRSFRTGNISVRSSVELSDNKFMLKIYFFIKAIIIFFISLFMTILTFPSKIKKAKWLIKLSDKLGHMMALFNIHYKEYK